MSEPQQPNPQQPGGAPEPTWPAPGSPATPPEYDTYGQQPADYGQPTYQQPAYGQPGYPQGAYQQPAYSPGYPPPGYAVRRTNGLAVASLVCSLAGLITGISAPVGAILGHMARRQIRETGEEGDGMAQAGIIVGWILTGLFLCICVGYIAVVALALGTAGATG